MKNDINKTSVFLLVVIFTFSACTNEHRHNRHVEVFYPYHYVDHYSVEYRKDTIIITETNKAGEQFKKLRLTMDKGEYYLEILKSELYFQPVRKALFMSNSKIDYQKRYDDIPQHHSVRIKKYDEDTFYAELIVHPTQEDGNPLLCIEYDRKYKIKRILAGAIYEDYAKKK